MQLAQILLFILSKVHSVAFTSTLKMPLYSSQSRLFRAVKPFFIIFRAVCVVTAFYLLQVFFGWRFQLPLALCSCLPFFFGLLALSLSLGEKNPTFLARMDLFPSSFKAFHGTPFAPRTVSTANLSVFFSFCLQRIVVTFLAFFGRA